MTRGRLAAPPAHDCVVLDGLRLSVSGPRERMRLVGFRSARGPRALVLVLWSSRFGPRALAAIHGSHVGGDGSVMRVCQTLAS